MNATLDASVFNRAMRELSRQSGTTMPKVIRSEASKVLGLCVSYTTAPKPGNYPRTAKPSTSGEAKLDIVTDAGKVKSPNSGVGAVWLSTPIGAMVNRSRVRSGSYAHYFIRRPDGSPGTSIRNGKPLRFPDSIWGLAQSMLARAEAENAKFVKQKITAANREARKIKGRGLAKQSFVQIARALGIPIDPSPPAYVLAAVPQNGGSYRSGTGREISTSEQFVLVLENSYPLLTGSAKKKVSGIDGQRIMQSALNARAKAFMIDLKLGVFNDFQRRAARYPGIFVK